MRYLLSGFLLTVALSLFAQDQGAQDQGAQDQGALDVQSRDHWPDFYLGLDHILDNREYFTTYGTHETYYGIRINPGLMWNVDSLHRIHLGINYMYEFGAGLWGVEPQLDLYYHYKNEQLGSAARTGGLEFLAGSFPKEAYLDYPLFGLNDSLSYYRPNIEGALIRYAGGWGHAQAWLDWMSRETEDVRESIMAGIDAHVNFAGYFYAEGFATRYHLARTTAVSDTNRVHDEMSLMLFAGLDLAEETPLDQLDLSGGYISSYSYTRGQPYEWSRGYMLRLRTMWHFLGFRATWYQGDPSRQRMGEALYSHGDYARFDLFVDPFKNPRISSKIGWNLHYLPGEGLFHSQQVLISIRL